MTLSPEILLDGIAVAAFAVDERGTITAWNSAAERLIGRDVATVKGARSSVALTGRRGLSPVDRALADEDVVEERYTLRTSDKTDLEANLVVRPLSERDGEVFGAVVTIVPVTSEAEERGQARMKGAMRAVSTPIVIADPDFVITDVNAAAEAFFVDHAAAFDAGAPGFCSTELVGNSILGVGGEANALRRTLSAEASLPYRTELQMGESHIGMAVTAACDEDGEIVGYTFVFEDTTERRRAQVEQGRLSSVLKFASSMYTVVDNDRTIVYCNPALIEMLTSYEAELRAHFPSFSASRLVGMNIDSFHKDPSKQRSILEDASRLPFHTDIGVGPLEFGLSTFALFDGKGDRIGSAVEWSDQNARAAYRREINRVMDAARSGQLGVRGDLDSLDDAFRPMMQVFNEMIDVMVEPIIVIEKHLSKLATGDLTSYMGGNYEGAHDQLKSALNGTLDALNTALSKVKQVAQSVTGGARQVSDTANALSQGATEQASSLAQISSEMSRIAEQTGQNAQNAEVANNLANTARENAVKGDSMMADMVNAMGEIEDSSQSIRKIIKVIDDIAFQTNLLALNAAVEAARAGVHGKGFAVVAEEVRSLAARSAKAASETTEMIEDSINKVEQGTNIATRTASALKDIVNDVGKVSDLVAGIASASDEQSRGISTIDESLTQIDKVTQTNTASAEESAAGSQDLARQARELQDRLSGFKLKEPSAAKPMAGLPDNLPPELLAAIAQMLGERGYGGGSAANNSPSTGFGFDVAAGSDFDGDIDPGVIVPLDDDDFGKY